MMELIGQMLLCLLLAFLLGLLLGWLLWARSCKKQIEGLEASFRDRLSDCERSLRSARTEISDLKNRREVAAPKEPTAAAAPAPDPAPPKPEPAGVLGLKSGGEDRRDNLKKVEGIGPKIEQLLNADGIFTWAQLAAASTETIQGILDRAGDRYRIHDPATWPDQAKLLSEGRLEELEKFQDLLKGGRPVQ